MDEKELLKVKRDLKKKDIDGVIVSIHCPKTSRPHIDNFPVYTSKFTGKVEIKISYKTCPDNIKAIDQAIEILSALKDKK